MSSIGPKESVFEILVALDFLKGVNFENQILPIKPVRLYRL